MRSKFKPQYYIPRWLSISLFVTYGFLFLQGSLLYYFKQIFHDEVYISPTNTPEIEVNVSDFVSNSSPSPNPTLTPQQTPTPGIGTTKLSEKDSMTMVFVPAGEFIMGANTSWDDINNDELPQHEVLLDAFWIDKTEVTSTMFAKFLNEVGNLEEEGTTWLDADDSDVGLRFSGNNWQPRADYKHRDSYAGAAEYTANYPAFEVTWYGANAYCEWVGKRLPTEAEWEKAARGPSGNKYPWGNNRDGCYARVSGCWFIVGEQLLDVGSWPTGASPYGCLDMLGNVWEWTADWYDENYYSYSPDNKPTGPDNGQYKTIRGSSWEYETVPITRRSRLSPELSDGALGFRCVMDVD